MKKDRLQTVNKWNRVAFMPEEMFLEGKPQGTNYGRGVRGNRYDVGGSVSGGISGLWGLGTPDFTPKIDTGAISQNMMATQLQKNDLSGKPKGTNLFGNLGNSLKEGLKSGAFNEVGNAIGGMVGNAISNGYSSGAGDMMNTVGDVASGLPGPLGAAASAGAKVLGGITNWLWGEKIDEKRMQRANADIAAMKGYVNNAATTNEFKQHAAAEGVDDIVKVGLLRSSNPKQDELDRRFREATEFADRSDWLAANNINRNQYEDNMRSSFGLGGYLPMTDSNGMGAIEYGFMSDWLDNKRRKMEDKKGDGWNFFVGKPQSTLFALGGDVVNHQGQSYIVGEVYNVSEEEANRLKKMGYEFRVIG